MVSLQPEQEWCFKDHISNDRGASEAFLSVQRYVTIHIQPRPRQQKGQTIFYSGFTKPKLDGGNFLSQRVQSPFLFYKAK